MADPELQSEPTACPNCGASVSGKYCSNCGQLRPEVRISVGRLVRDFLEDQLSVNAALPRTLRALFFHPGRLTNEYFAGRIVTYIPPFRLYLISSLLFFVALSFFTRWQTVDIVDPNAPVAAADSLPAPPPWEPAQPDSLKMFLRVGTLRLGVKPGAKTFADAIDLELGNDRLERATIERLRALDQLPPEEAPKQLMRSLIQQAPKVVFLLLPAYALLLHLLYLRRKRYYVEHFIFALHVHAFAFLVFFAILVLSRNLFMFIPLALWLPLYTLLAMKRVYGQGWIRTLLKWGVVGLTYLLLFWIALLFTFVAAVFAL